jgi:hypothetical protein
MNNPERTYHRCLCFTKVPLAGQFRYKDVFQILPANLDGLPKSKYQKHFPVILEYWTTEEERTTPNEDWEGLTELVSDYTARFRKEDRILTLLSTVTNNLFFKYSANASSWGMPILTDDPGEEVNEQSAVWCFRIFHFPELPSQFSISGFSKKQFDDIGKRKHLDYFLHDPNLDFDENRVIEFPATIERMLDSYFNLDNNTVSIINTAASYIVAAMELYGNRNTMSLLSSFTAMETMVNLEFRAVNPIRCTTCGQPQHKVAAKFKEYLLKYIGHSDNNKRKFNSYYALRSKIVHTGQQLKTESLFSDVSSEEQEKELLTRIEVLQTSRLAIANWLLYNHRKEEKHD